MAATFPPNDVAFLLVLAIDDSADHHGRRHDRRYDIVRYRPGHPYVHHPRYRSRRQHLPYPHYHNRRAPPDSPQQDGHQPGRLWSLHRGRQRTLYHLDPRQRGMDLWRCLVPV